MVRDPRRASAAVAEEVVEEHARTDVEPLDDGSLEGVEESDRLDEVRGEALEQKSALDERLPHEPEVQLLQVTDAAVHELGRPARGAAAPVAGLHEPDAQAAGDRIHGAAGSDDAAADDEDVEFLLLERGDRGRPLGRTELRRSGDGLLRHGAP